MKKITLVLAFLLCLISVQSQTIMSPGDIAFMGSNVDGTTNADDSIVFVLLKDIDAATEIIFTDRGWSNTDGFSDFDGDGDFIWTSGTDRTAGDIITIDMSPLFRAAYGLIGDQLFAIQGSIATPTFIAGLQFNEIAGGGSDDNWDGEVTSNATSELPTALTTGDTAVRLVSASNEEQDNWQFSCALAGGTPISGTPSQIRAILHNRTFWNSDPDLVFSPALEARCLVKVCHIEIGEQPIDVALCKDETTLQFTVVATGIGTLSYNWQAFGNGLPEWTDLGIQNGNAILNLTAPIQPEASGTQYRVIITDDLGTPDTADDCEVISEIATLTVYPITMVTFTAPLEQAVNSGLLTNLGGGLPIGGIYSGTGVTDDNNGETYTFDTAFLDGGAVTVTYTFIDTNGCIVRANDNIEVARNPTLVSTDPVDDAINVNSEATLTATFSEPIQFATGGEIVIQNLTTGTPFGSVSAGSAAITFSGNSFTIDPMAPFLASNEYEVQIDATDLEDATGNPFAGITSGGWTFTIVPAEPVVDCTGIDGVKNNDPGECFYTVVGNEFNATATDNVGVVSLINNYNNGSSLAGVTFPVGTTTVIWTATDADNNMGTCSVDIVITDNEGPTAVVQNVILELNAQGEVSPNVFSVGAIVSRDDNCGVGGGVGVTGPRTYTCDNIGVNPVTIFIRDINGNETPYDITYTITDPLSACVDKTPCEVTIVQEPQDVDVTVCDIEPLGIFRVEASSSGTLTYLWEEKVIGSCCTWSALTANESTLEIAPEALAAANGSKFRVTVTSDNGTPGDITDDCSVTSDEVTLTTVSLEPKPDIPVNLGLQTNLGGGLPAQGTQLGDIGVYSGPGVIDDGNGLTYSFDPEVAGEGIQTITYTYTNGNGCTSSASDDILIFPAMPLLSINDVSQVEGTGGTTSFVFEVRLSEPSTQIINVGYSTFDNFAVSPDDYDTASGTLTFNPGETSKNINIKIVPDSEIEQDETFLVQLSGAGGDVWYLNFIGTGTILNDDKECEVVIEAQPMDAMICAGDPLRFDATYTANGVLTYQWQVDTGTGFLDLGTPSASSQLNFAFMQIGGDGNQYRVIATSDNGTPNDGMDDCSETSEAATLTVNPLPKVEITGTDNYCYNGIGVELDAGAGHSSYLWSPGGATTQTISATEGSYTVQVTNEFGCTKISEVFKVTNNQPLVCNILQDVLATNYLTADGVATVNTTGGTGQFTYLWDNGETTQTATTLTYGMHSVTVTDSNECETTCQIDIAKELYCWTNLVQNVSVLGGNDGEAMVKGNGGYRPYTFRWDDGTTNAVNAALTPGTHYVTITDATGATSQCSVTITEPNKGNCNDFVSTVEQDKLATNHVTEDGVATVYPKGGSGQYMYLWDNGETTQTATTLTYGIHSVTVIDANGCKASSQIDIAKELYCWTNLIKNVSSYSSKDGAAQARGNGGYRPYTFMWDDGSTEELNSNLGAGTHYVTITDATGATSQCSVTITEPKEEVCDGIDNDGDGKVDEGFDQDGDGIADCFDICDKGDDHVDMDNDGIPDACDDTICIKVEKPMTECYQTAVWNEQTCSWIISGVKPLQPMTECNQTAEWNGTTCTWDIIDGQRPEMPMTECYQTAAWNTQTCSWDVTGDKPMEPMTECHQTAVWNSDNCEWDILDGQPDMPMIECYQMAEWNPQTCMWDVTGDKPMQPDTECYQTAVWSDQICDWEIKGDKPMEPVTECYETATWNEADCQWDIIDGQSEMPMTLCYQTAVWSDQICDWEINGDKPMEPETECYETATFNEVTCEWEVTGVQPEMPMTACNETAVWDEMACDWNIIENNNDCGSGPLDKCETAFARSADENVRSCFLGLPNVSGNRWGWTNEFPTTNGTYNMDLYAAAGQCNISSGFLVGNVEVTYTDGAVEVTVSTFSGNKMTVAQLYVGTEILPTDNNGRLTTAPGQFPYHDTVEGDFNTFTFDSVDVGNSGSFYVVLHADVCPNETLVTKTASANLDLTAYPVPFKDNLNVKVASPLNMNGTLSLYNGVGQKVQDFGRYTLKKGENEINLNTVELPIGLYFIRMTSVYGTETLKILRK